MIKKIYSNYSELPKDIRDELFKKGLNTKIGDSKVKVIVDREIIINGVKYDSLDEVPEKFRKLLMDQSNLQNFDKLSDDEKYLLENNGLNKPIYLKDLSEIFSSPIIKQIFIATVILIVLLIVANLTR